MEKQTCTITGKPLTPEIQSIFTGLQNFDAFGVVTGVVVLADKIAVTYANGDTVHFMPFTPGAA